MNIRPERKGDEPVIDALTQDAFRDMPFSDQTEHLIVNKLRENNVLTLSLVAIEQNQICGHIAFSPVTINGGAAEGWYGLGPVSVRPSHQRQGIGKALISNGLERLKHMQAQGCVVVGHTDYYPRFGFKNTDDLIYEQAPAKYFHVLYFSSGRPKGSVDFHSSFYVTK